MATGPSPSKRTHERVPFRLLQTPCCSALLCWVNPRFPSYCPECGTFIFPRIKGCVLQTDDRAMLSLSPTIGENLKGYVFNGEETEDTDTNPNPNSNPS